MVNFDDEDLPQRKTKRWGLKFISYHQESQIQKKKSNEPGVVLCRDFTDEDSVVDTEAEEEVLLSLTPNCFPKAACRSA